MKIDKVFANTSSQNKQLHMPYIIAEAGVNHEGSVELAKRLIEEAKEGGADAIKFQTYKASTLASKDSPAYWDLSKEKTKTQFELFSKHDRFWKTEMELLKAYCDEIQIDFMSTPFDIESAQFLNDLMDVYKISSSDLTNKPFIELICSFDKPIILSTGASELFEIQEAVHWISQFGNPLALLHCVLNYPTPDESANLGMIMGLQKAFPDYVIGYSDHTLPKNMKALEVAAMFGCKIIEKHFTHDKSLPGNDHYHAMDKEDLKLFRTNLDTLYRLVGEIEVKALPEEKIAIQNARRSLVAKRFLKAGDVVRRSDLTFKRPGKGISPKHIDQVVGKVVKEDIDEDAILKWGMLN